MAFMRALLARHPRAAEKIGLGVRAIRVDANSVWGGSPMLTIVRTDGTTTDFSYMKCICTPSARGRLQAACRRAVVEDVLAFKREYFRCHADEANRVLCPLSGKRLGWTEVHVDHAPPWAFRRIVDAFVERHDMQPSAVAILGAADGQVEPRLADRELADQFRCFHASVAHLRVVAVTENLRASRQ